MAASQSSPLCNLPLEILVEIALEVVCHPTDPLQRRSHIIPLLCTCTYIFRSLGIYYCTQLYARIYKAHFDTGAARRRFGLQALNSPHLVHELRANCRALQTIRSGDIRSPRLLGVLWTCFYMLIENDGKNYAQLEAVGLNAFVDLFVRERLYEGSAQNNGWPVDNSINSLALWLLWLTTTQEQLAAEPPERRHQLVQLILPFVIMPFRYAVAAAPPNHHNIPLSNRFEGNLPRFTATAHGSYPVYRCQTINQMSHFDKKDMDVSPPLITIAAKLLYFSRREAVPIVIPPHLPVNRAEAVQRGIRDVGPTQEDVVELNAYKHAKLVPRTKWDWWTDCTPEVLADEDAGVVSGSPSCIWDDDWARMVGCINLFSKIRLKGAVYSSGLLTGLWQGRLVIPNEPEYARLMATPHYPAGFSERSPLVTAFPIFMRLREYHSINPAKHLGTGGRGDGFDDGLGNAWTPPMRYRSDSESVIFEDGGGNVYKYEAYVHGRPNSHSVDTCTSCIERGTSEVYLHEDLQDVPELEEDFERVGLGQHASDEADSDDDDDDDDDEEKGEYSMRTSCSGIQDIVLVGETDWSHGQAWNHYRYYGRVRRWDGLIAIVRVPTNESALDGSTVLGRWIFVGYVVGGQNFVGTWRVADTVAGATAPTWESAFVMSKRD